MAEDLQSLLEKINRDGVEKANAEAAKIVAEARARAENIVKEAREEAAKAKAAAEKAAADYVARAEETVGQAARDTLIEVEKAVTDMLENLLAKDVDAALADEKNVAALVLEAVRNLAGPAEVEVPKAMAQSLKAQLAASGSITVAPGDRSLTSGFSIKIDGGRVEHSFTGAVVAEELARRLRPDLARLVRRK